MTSLADQAKLDEIQLESIKAEAAVRNFLKRNKAGDIYAMRVPREKVSLDHALLRRFPLPQDVDIGRLTEDKIDFEMLAQVLDLPAMQIGDGAAFPGAAADDVDQAVAAPAAHEARRAPLIVGNPADDCRERVFFQLTCKHPKKILDGITNIVDSDVVISLLRTYTLDVDSSRVLVGDHKDPNTGFVLSWKDLLDGMHSLRICEMFPQLHFGLPGLKLSMGMQVSVSEVLAALMSCDAHEAGFDGKVMSVDNGDSETLGTLEFLLRHKVVDKLADSGSVSSWRITLEGQDALESCMQIRTTDLVARPRMDIPLNQMTAHDLIAFLEKEGWVAHVWHRERHAGDEPAPYDVSKELPKEWWIKPNTRVVSQPYLYALAAAEQSHCQEIRHLKADKYYKDLFKSRISVFGDKGIDMNDLEVQRRPGGAPGAPRGGALGEQRGRRRPAFKTRTGNERSYAWGAGYMTFKPKPGANGEGTWQATCPRHKGAHYNPVNPATRCRLTMSFKTAEDDVKIQMLAKHWMNSCKLYSTRQAHQRARPRLADLPDAQNIEANMLPEGWDSDDDGMAVREAAEEEKPRKQGRNRGRGGGRRGRGGRGQQPPARSTSRPTRRRRVDGGSEETKEVEGSEVEVRASSSTSSSDSSAGNDSDSSSSSSD